MPLHPDVITFLIQQGVSPEVVARAAGVAHKAAEKAAIKKEAEAMAARRVVDRDRQRRHREKLRSRRSNVTERDTPLPKERSPTPPKENKTKTLPKSPSRNDRPLPTELSEFVEGEAWKGLAQLWALAGKRLSGRSLQKMIRCLNGFHFAGHDVNLLIRAAIEKRCLWPTAARTRWDQRNPEVRTAADATRLAECWTTYENPELAARYSTQAAILQQGGDETGVAAVPEARVPP